MQYVFRFHWNHDKYYGGEKLDCEQLYEKADQALYYVKNNGKDAYHLFESMPEDLKITDRPVVRWI